MTVVILPASFENTKGMSYCHNLKACTVYRALFDVHGIIP